MVGEPEIHHHGTTSSTGLMFKKSTFWFTGHATGFLFKPRLHKSFMFWAPQLSAGSVSLTEHISAKSKRPSFPLFFLCLVFFCIWISPPSQPPSTPIQKNSSLSIPPSFFFLPACSLSVLPPAQTSSQTPRVDGKYDWILFPLTSDNVRGLLAKRGTTKK